MMPVSLKNPAVETIQQQFAQMVASEVPDEQADLLGAALLISKALNPDVNAESCVHAIEQLAGRVRRRLGDSFGDPRATISALNHVLFIEESFRGNADDYYDPRNSFIDQVLERKLGIPITLSLVYMEVARRAGLPLVGVGMPGHFLVKHFDVDGRELIIDCFNGGAILSRADCQRRFREHFAGEGSLKPEHLGSVTPRQMLTRMINNLRNSYISSRDFRRALVMLDLLLTIFPRNPEDVKQRAVLRYHTNILRGAAEDFETYVNMAPDAPDAAEMRGLAVSIRRSMAMMN